MSFKRVVSMSAIVATMLVGSSRGAGAQDTSEVVLEWNRILQSTLGVAGALPPTIFVTRPYAR